MFSASFYTSYEYKHFLWNTPALLLCVIPKLPQLHGVRVFGINKYWTKKLLHNICSICAFTATLFDCNSNLVRSCICPHMYTPTYSNKTIAQNMSLESRTHRINRSQWFMWFGHVQVFSVHILQVINIWQYVHHLSCTLVGVSLWSSRNIY